MTKITVFEQQLKDGKPSGYKIELADGTKGYLVEKESDKDLGIGVDVTYTSVTPEGKSYKKITAHRVQSGAPAPSNASHGIPLKPQSANCGCGTSDLTTMKFEARMKCIDLAHKAYLEGKLTDGEAKEHCVAWVAVADGLINELAK